MGLNPFQLHFLTYFPPGQFPAGYTDVPLSVFCPLVPDPYPSWLRQAVGVDWRCLSSFRLGGLSVSSASFLEWGRGHPVLATGIPYCGLRCAPTPVSLFLYQDADFRQWSPVIGPGSCSPSEFLCWGLPVCKAALLFPSCSPLGLTPRANYGSSFQLGIVYFSLQWNLQDPALCLAHSRSWIYIFIEPINCKRSREMGIVGMDVDQLFVFKDRMILRVCIV